MRERINRKITASQVKLISEDNAELGIFPIEDALKLAASRHEDLVEIGPNATPPVCLVIDYGKYRYRKTKKEREKGGL
jgi:translation initiation factor IF-3